MDIPCQEVIATFIRVLVEEGGPSFLNLIEQWRRSMICALQTRNKGEFYAMVWKSDFEQLSTTDNVVAAIHDPVISTAEHSNTLAVDQLLEHAQFATRFGNRATSECYRQILYWSKLEERFDRTNEVCDPISWGSGNC